MSLIGLHAPCWTFTCRFDRHNPLIAEHVPSQIELEFCLHSCDRAYQLDRRCIRSFCDRCGDAYHRPGDYTAHATHFATRRAATAALLLAGWTTNSAAEWHCQHCPALLARTETGPAHLVRAA